MKWLKPNPRPHQTALAMIGAKPGQQVLLLGAGDGRLAAAVAGLTGLNGRTLVVDPSAEAQQRVEAAAADAGVLVEFEPGPAGTAAAQTGAFDIVVMLQRLADPGSDAPALVSRAVALLRPGGRLVAIEGEAASGWLGRFQRPRPAGMPGEAARDLLASAGLRAARVLGEAEGVTYIEGSKPR